MKKHINIVSIILCSILGSLTANAAPSVYYKDEPKLVFTMWDVVSDKSYVIDLRYGVPAFIEKPEEFQVNVIDLIKQATSDKISSVKNFRWSVVGVYVGPKDFGYLGSYPETVEPRDVNYIYVGQRIQRFEYYLSDHFFTNNDYRVAFQESDMPSHYLLMWQGDFNGLSPEKLEGRGGGNPMIMWSYISVSKNKIAKEQIGAISLSSDGVLKFEPLD